MITSVLAFLLVGHAPQEPQGGTVRKNAKGIEMVYVPAGEFKMGGESGDEKPIRQVTLDGFWFGKTVVTVAQFKIYCSEEGVDFNKFTEPSWGWIARQ